MKFNPYVHKKPYLSSALAGLGVFVLEKGPAYRPFRDLRFVPEYGRPREQVENHGRGLSGTFSWSEDPSTAWLVPSTAEDPACLLKTRFFKQTGKGAENTKEKSRQCFIYCWCSTLATRSAQTVCRFCTFAHPLRSLSGIVQNLDRKRGCLTETLLIY